MLFNSIHFALFFPIVFALYWFVFQKNLRWQNMLLLVASYYFYSCWDWRFLFLLIFSTLLDYFTGLMMSHSERQAVRRRWFWLSVVVNLGFLGVFKYYDFFVTSFADALAGMGMQVNVRTLNIILPVGISFYTFHGLSYVIDIYYRRIEPCRNFVDYAVFVSFFPLLVAGPIERATHLLPQIQRPRSFDLTKAIDGSRQIIWGLFKKMVIADSCAEYADLIFGDTTSYSGSTLLVGVFFFTIQVYCDFSGYSDIALGTARLLGIELLRNFAFPFFARDIAEFWRRWHISLTTWFRDYLYIPLGGSRGSTLNQLRNIFLVYIISGFWHGANWTYIVWGALHAVYFIPLLLLKRNRVHTDIVAQGRLLPSLREVWGMTSTFWLLAFSLIFFRAESMTHAFLYIERMFTGALFQLPDLPVRAYVVAGLIVFFMLIEWLGREQHFAIALLEQKWTRPVRWAFYYSLIIGMIYFNSNARQFIYFQF